MRQSVLIEQFTMVRVALSAKGARYAAGRNGQELFGGNNSIRCIAKFERAAPPEDRESSHTGDRSQRSAPPW